MTPADIVAEALAHAEDAVPQSIGKRHDQYVIVDEDRDIDDSGWGLTMMANEQHVSTRKPRVVYVRHDAMLAALAHLATKAAEAEARAATAEAALMKSRLRVTDLCGFVGGITALLETGRPWDALALAKAEFDKIGGDVEGDAEKEAGRG